MSRRIVIVYGRFNPPTTGHQRLFDYATTLAKRTRADFVVFPSFRTGKDNPLPPNVKLHFLRRLFPDLTFNGNPSVRTIVDCLQMISRKYREATLVVGSDRASEFAWLYKYIRARAPVVTVAPPKAPDENSDEPVAPPEITTTPRVTAHIRFRKFRIVTVPGRRDASVGVQGMSARKQRQFAIDGDYDSFRKGVPSKNDRLAEQLYTSVRHYMGIKETKGQAFLLYGTTPRAAVALREAFAGVDKKRWRDVTGKSFADIKRMYQMAEAKGYRVTIYTRDLPMMAESVLRHKSTLGLIKEAFARDIVDVLHRDDVRAAHDVAGHARRLMEEGPAKPKPPSEVDKLRIQQQRELLLTKQRQAQELLAAKQRELNDKTREAAAKIAHKNA